MLSIVSSIKTQSSILTLRIAWEQWMEVISLFDLPQVPGSPIVIENVLAACDWDMIFSFVMTGWEGSVADGYLFEEGIHNGFDIPQGKYYVADAGFPLCDKLIVPFHNIHYHLWEWEAASIWYVLNQLYV